MSPRRAGRPGPPLELEIAGGVAVLTLARPAAGNVLDDALMHALVAAADTLADRDELCAVVLRARGAAFSRGLPPAGTVWSNVASGSASWRPPVARASCASRSLGARRVRYSSE